MLAGHPLDKTDIKILSILQENGRLSNVELAEMVCLSPSPCLKRVKKLEQEGFIERYQAKINISKLLDHILVFTEITLSDHRREDFLRFEENVRQVPFVTACHLISGGYDYLLEFKVRSVAHYQEVIENILELQIGVEKYFSYIVIKSVFDRSEIPIKALLPDASRTSLV